MTLQDLVNYIGAQLANGPAIVITAISAANPAVCTAVGHGLTSGAQVSVTGSNSTPTINGTRVVTVIDVDHFSVPVNVTIAGTTASAQAGGGTPAIDLFEGEMPDGDGTPDLCSQVQEYGGLPDQVAFGVSDVYREQPRLQFLTRGRPRVNSSGRARLETIRRIVAKIPWPVSINGVLYSGVQVLQPPFWLKRDAQWRNYHAVNVQFLKDPVSQ